MPEVKAPAMLKIEQFVEQHFGIKLTKHQLEMIAIMAASPEREFILQNTGRSSGKTVAFKAAMAYLQDGMKPADDNHSIGSIQLTGVNKVDILEYKS